MQNSLLLDLFQGATAKVLSRGVTCLPVKQVGLAIPNPTLFVSDNYTALYVVTGNLVRDPRVKKQFKTRYHALILLEGCGNIWHYNVQNTQMALD